jgi:hypothetical protein
MRCANFVLKHSRKDQNRSNGLDEIEFSQRLVYQEKNGKPESKQGVQEYTLISLISRGSPVQSGAPLPIFQCVMSYTVVKHDRTAVIGSIVGNTRRSPFLKVCLPPPPLPRWA